MRQMVFYQHMYYDLRDIMMMIYPTNVG